ncbi:alpha-N-acetylgalactosaminide alpha-2,6-sialyltransferase 2-like [Triplophysa rosa]|uniref:alpha-N-acetylgalactosaminide alpha-2,6-sialyltransferase 2-like n=1 Tax=Triplophysa rosa TaxID=992332 RepID=UPI002546121C|nr:alpha-N-acetylgalactosaminide alpha-2,6-sialyltransferase 2-like [Triplophysa rosa]
MWEKVNVKSGSRESESTLKNPEPNTPTGNTPFKLTAVIDLYIRPSRYFGFNPQIHQFRMIHPHFIQYVTKRFLNSPQMEMYRDFYMPSTGAQMLLTALHTCDQVSAYGFMTDNYEDFSDHYYDSEYRPLVHYANHDLRMEGWLWKLLHTHKVMWLYQRYKKRSDVTHRKNSAHV